MLWRKIVQVRPQKALKSLIKSCSISTQRISKDNISVINNAVTLLKHYGIDNVKIDVIPKCPGLIILTNKRDSKERASSLAQQDIRFTACATTMKGIKRQTGKNAGLGR